MASITGTTVVERARTLLQDTAGIRWTDTEMLGWANDGRREMARLMPSIFAETSAVQHTTSAGPAQRCASLGAYRVLSVDSDSAGKAIRPTTKSVLDAFHPGWRADTATSAHNWFPDDADPLRFWIYPAVGAGKTLNLHILASPADLAALTQVALPLDIYEPILMNYLCFRAYSKETEAGAVEKAAAYFKLFTEALS